MTSRRAGFTLVEAIVALTLSSVLVVLVGTVFLVQNQYYAVQLERSAAQDNARMATEMIASEIRSAMKGGVVTAANRHLVLRSPIVVAVVCGSGTGARVSVQMEGTDADIATDEVSGIALRDALTGAWTYHDASWSNFHQPGGTPAANCAARGADTTGIREQFHDFRRMESYFGGPVPVGSVLMVYRTVEYEFATSQMDPDTRALFRWIAGSDPVEFVTGMDTTSQFRYRTGGNAYASAVTGAGLSAIDAIRIQAQARRRPQAGATADVTSGWAVNVILRNGR